MYNKLFTKILDSSIWLEDHATLRVWVTLLASMDEDGFCPFASPRNLAQRACVSMEEVHKAIKCFESPDEFSSDPDNDGRRIERVPGGWIVLNAAKFREQVTRIDVKKKNRQRVKRYRDRQVGIADEKIENPDGFVYYVRSGSVVKIGFSKNPWSRIKEIRVANPEASLLAVEKGSFLLEKERHQQFKADWREGEWFTWTSEIESFVAQIVATTAALRNDYVTTAEADTEAETYTDTKASTRAREETRKVAHRISQAVNPEASEDLSEWVERIAVAHPRSRLKNLSAAEIPMAARTAILDAILLEAGKNATSPTEAAEMLLGVCEHLAETVPREEWKYIKPIPAYFGEFEYRRDPGEFQRNTRAQGGASNGKRGTDGNDEALRRFLGSTGKTDEAGSSFARDRHVDEATGGRVAAPLERVGLPAIHGGAGGVDAIGDHPGIQPGHGGVQGILPESGYPARVQWPRR